MKAWSVNDIRSDENYIEVVFAESRGKAILASEAFGESGEYTDMRAKRLKVLDDKENMPVNERMRILIKEEGWYWDIGDAHINEDNLEESIKAGLI